MSGSGGVKQPSSGVMRRRLALVRALLRGPATAQQLIVAVNAERLKAPDAERPQAGYPDAAEAALKHDISTLRGDYGCVISYERGARRYRLVCMGHLALLEVPEATWQALDDLYDGREIDLQELRPLVEQLRLLAPPRRPQPPPRGRGARPVR